MRVVAWVLAGGTAVVLLGQLWPEGAPPFARAVNIAVLSADLVYLGLIGAGWRSNRR